MHRRDSSNLKQWKQKIKLVLYLQVPLRFLPTILLVAAASTAAWGLGRGPWGLGLGTGIGPVVEETLRGGLGVMAGDSLWGPMAASALWMGTWGSDIYRQKKYSQTTISLSHTHKSLFTVSH
jgi:hypothetical protein